MHFEDSKDFCGGLRHTHMRHRVGKIQTDESLGGTPTHGQLEL